MRQILQSPISEVLKVQVSQPSPLETIVNLLYFPMTVSNAVDVATQATGVATSSPTFSRLVASNGTTISAVPAYSTTYVVIPASFNVTVAAALAAVPGAVSISGTLTNGGFAITGTSFAFESGSFYIHVLVALV